MRSGAIKKYVTIGATFSLALGIGFVMQNGDVLASRIGVDAKGDTLASVSNAHTPVTGSAFIQPQARISSSGEITSESTGVVVSADADAPDTNAPNSIQITSIDCKVQFKAAPMPSAMVALSLDAPCAPDTRVLIQHQGLKFTALTDSQGDLNLDVPALAKEAFFVATVGDGMGLAAITGVPDVDAYDRAVLQWRGDSELQLHAFEFGAKTGQEGHIWTASTGSPAASVTGENGYLTVLGDSQTVEPMMAQVYTFPTGKNSTDGKVALQVKAEVTQVNCNREMTAQSIQIRPNTPPAARNMTLRLPECSRIGQDLVLKNMFEDLTIASR